MTAKSTAARVSPSQEQTVHPYAPSWVDRFSAWVDRLPGPAWAAYLLLGTALVLLHASGKWYDGVYPVGVLHPLHVVAVITSVYYLAMIHYTDSPTRRALVKFQPALDPTQADLDSLIYRMTTSPPRETWLATLVGLLCGTMILVASARGLVLDPSAMIFSGPVSSALDTLAGLFGYMMLGLTLYHSVRQLRMIHHIYTRYTRIDVFNLSPLYALSQLAARTAIGWMVIATLWLIAYPQLRQDIVSLGTVVIIALLGTAAFIWPLLGVHALLEEEKARVKAEANRRLKAVIVEFHRHIDNEQHQAVAPLVQTVEGLKQELEIIEKIPTWPWQHDTQRTVATAVLLPVGVWLIQQALALLLDI